jgi:ubiquinone/menaquinone biosynthesis C-methylase UbiE
MKSSLSFDHAASFYDRTRDLPEPGGTLGIQAILEIVGPGALILDIGTGTGRISVPLLERGADLIGCDLSTKMMALLRQKYPPARLVQADASQLPFPGRHFDALLTCHVMHLVGPWREALREYRRLLKPGGVYINVRTDHEGESVRKQMKDFWQSRVKAHGAGYQRPGVQNEEDLQNELSKIGADVRHVEVVRFSRTYSVREVIEDTANRIHSHTWGIPDYIFTTCLGELREWAGHTFSDPDQKIEEEVQFILDLAYFMV